MDDKATPREVGCNEGLGPTLDLLNSELPCSPPWGAGQYVSVYAVHQLLAAQRERWQKWTCRKEWDNVNDPPCHPGDKDWIPCAACAGPNAKLSGARPPRTRSQQLAEAGYSRRPGLWAMQARKVLELIAAPMRADGTWNRDREACRQLAAEALGRYDDA